MVKVEFRVNISLYICQGKKEEFQTKEAKQTNTRYGYRHEYMKTGYVSELNGEVEREKLDA